MRRIQKLFGLFALGVLSGCALITPRSSLAEITVETQAVSGINTRELEILVNTRLEKPEPIDYAIVMIGTNDSINTMNDVPVAEYELNMKRILQKLIDHGAMVYVAEILPCLNSYVLARHPSLTNTPNDLIFTYNEALHRAAEATDPPTPVISTNALFATHTDFTQGSWIRNKVNSDATDGVHPTAEGNRQIAQVYADTLDFKRSLQRNVVLWGNSITLGVHHNYPDRIGDYLYMMLNTNGARDWALYE